MQFLTTSPSSLDNFLFCERSYEMGNLLGYRYPKNSSMNINTTRGTLMHKMLEMYYKSRKETTAIPLEIYPTVVEYGRFYGDTKLHLPAEEIAKTCLLFEEYVISHHQETWVPLEVEKKFSKIFYVREDTENSEGLTILMEGKIDLLIEIPDAFDAPVDHKTGTRSYKRDALETQFIAYAWATDSVRLIVNDLIYDCKDDKKRFQRTVLNYSEELLDEWHKDTLVRMMQLDTYLQSQYFPGNYSSCMKSKYGPCKFLHVCNEGLTLRQQILDRDFERVEEDYDLFND